MSLDPITAALDIGGKIIDKIWPDPVQRDAAKLELFKLQQSGDLALLIAETELAKAQIATNTAEAASGSAYAAGWRPSVGYICCAGLAYTFLLQPLLPWLVNTLGAHVAPLPSLDSNVLMTLLGGMLGIGGMRSFEKAKRVA